MHPYIGLLSTNDNVTWYTATLVGFHPTLGNRPTGGGGFIRLSTVQPFVFKGRLSLSIISNGCIWEQDSGCGDGVAEILIDGDTEGDSEIDLVTDGVGTSA